jgi:hypothetical protein
MVTWCDDWTQFLFEWDHLTLQCQNVLTPILYYSRFCSAVVAGATEMPAGATAEVFFFDTDKPSTISKLLIGPSEWEFKSY